MIRLRRRVLTLEQRRRRRVQREYALLLVMALGNILGIAWLARDVLGRLCQ